MKDMKKLAEKGRNGDTRVAHLTEGEVVIPKEVAKLRPDLIAHVAEQLRRMGGNPGEMIVGRGRKNPETGIEEFATEEEVRAAYRQILGRDPDAEGLKYWMGDGDFNIDVFRQAAKPELITQAYDQTLGRAPDPGGAAYWQNDPNFNLGTFAIAAQPELARQQQTMRDKLGSVQGQYGDLQSQLATLQAQYDALLKEQNAGPAPDSSSGSDGATEGDLYTQVVVYGLDGTIYNSPQEAIAAGENNYTMSPPRAQNPNNSGGSANTGIVGGGVVNESGSSYADSPGLGNSGIVYGPDGTPFSSAAAAIAAGASNFSFVKPVLPQSPAGPGLITGADRLTSLPTTVTGSINPGSLIAGQNSQLFKRPTGVQLPAGVVNPF